MAVTHIAWSQEAAPPCYGPESYATQVALSELVNSGRAADASAFYRKDDQPFDLRTQLLDAERVGRYAGPGLAETDLYRQI